MFTLFAACLAGLSVAAILAPLFWRRAAAPETGAEAGFYRAQVDEVAREAARGDLSGDEAAGARAEAARRLLRLADAAPPVAAPPNNPARLAALFACFAIIVAATGLYRTLGAPGLPDLPLAARKDAIEDQSLAIAIERIEARLKEKPDDGRGWEALGPAYMQAGRYPDAIHAFKEALRLKGPNAAIALRLGEALLTLSGGKVNGEAMDAFQMALKLAPENPEARFYAAMGAAQAGDKATALALFTALEADAPKDAPWLGAVRDQLAALKGADIAAAAPADQGAMIQGMVAGLAARLAAQGGSRDEWLRLIRAYAVLKKPDEALKALADARAAYPSDAEALKAFDALAQELKIAP